MRGRGFEKEVEEAREERERRRMAMRENSFIANLGILGAREGDDGNLGILGGDWGHFGGKK